MSKSNENRRLTVAGKSMMNETDPYLVTYDADGNMTSDGRFHYFWNAENRLVMASNDTSLVTYAYDHRGRMVRKEISHRGTEARRIEYLWDDWNIIREIQWPVTSDQWSVGTLATDHCPLVTDYFWGLDLDGTLQGAGGVGGLLAVVKTDCAATNSILYPLPSNLYLPTYDANGNISEYVSTNGEIVAHYDYSPFGEPLVTFGPLAAAFTHQFSTKPYCPVTRFSEYQMRKYRPEIGRWVSRDQIYELAFFNNNRMMIEKIILDARPILNHEILDDIVTYQDVVFSSASTPYQICRNTIPNTLDKLGMRCSVVVVMGHTVFVSKKIRTSTSSACDRFGAVSCFMDERMKEARRKFGPDVPIKNWPSHPGLLKCSDLPEILRQIGPPTNAAGAEMCSPPCCCKKHYLRFVCDADMSKCLSKLINNKKLLVNYCGKTMEYVCDKGAKK